MTTKMRATKRIEFDGMHLIHVDMTDFRFRRKPDTYHVPGGGIMSQAALVARAKKLGLPITRTEISSDGISTVSLV